MTLGVVADGQDAPTPQWQADSRHDWELEHESDGTADGRVEAAPRCPPGELGLAAGFLLGFTGLLALAAKKLPANDRHPHPTPEP